MRQVENQIKIMNLDTKELMPHTREASPMILGSVVLFHLAENNTYLHRVIGLGWTHVSGFSNGNHSCVTIW